MRALAMDAVQRAGAGHPGTAMALAPLGYTLFERFLKADPGDPSWPDRDRFVLSSGHACVLLYALLHLTGYDLSLEDLKQFRQWGSRTPGHPERGHVPGVEVTTGPLGQGVANAVGMAIAERVLAERFNRPGHEIVDHRTWVICSDGDLMEGISQEAASLAGSFALAKLTLCYDDNRITIDGTTALSFDGEDHGARFAASGWHVQRVDDAEDTEALTAALAAAAAEGERPSFISVRSHIAYPAPNAVDTAKAHGAPLGEAEVRATKEVLGFDPEQSFVVADEVYEHMGLRERGAQLHASWRERFAAWSAELPELHAEWERCHAGRLADGWEDELPSFTGGDAIATRSAGQKAMAAFAAHAPTMIGGAADLVESTKTVFEGAGSMSAVHAGRNVPFGIREHAMGGVVNGAAAHGGIVKPYGSTFLIFSDYMRASVRLSALMGLPVVWVWTHDSIGLGEDGPTHQPVEHFAALRVIPDLWVVRPSDANETAVAWRVALERRDGPVALLLSRQNIPVLDRGAGFGQAEELMRGGYVLWESAGQGHDHSLSGSATAVDGHERPGEAAPHLPGIVLMATGSEVAPALEAARSLAAEGVRARLVAMPCVELFEAQSAEYRERVLGVPGTVRLAVEPGASAGWWKWVGERGDVLGLDRFGASAPGPTVLEKLGFGAEQIAARARALLARQEEGGLR
ncbi:MAG: transketolase [Acidobacteriota bacterium]|nr:transketolase [Acidobacteriota bacterium]